VLDGQGGDTISAGRHTRNEGRTLTVVMKETLASLFKPYRPILPITAHSNVRMRGQAFVSFTDRDNANAARREVNEFPLYGKAMVGVLSFFSFTLSHLFAMVLGPQRRREIGGEDSQGHDQY
jgi:RNA recognition motif-containing protein